MPIRELSQFLPAQEAARVLDNPNKIPEVLLENFVAIGDPPEWHTLPGGRNHYIIGLLIENGKACDTQIDIHEPGRLVRMLASLVHHRARATANLMVVDWPDSQNPSV